MQSSGGVPALGKQKAVAVAAGRAGAMNRRAPLGDIGNFASVHAAEGYERNQAFFLFGDANCFLARSSSDNNLILGCRKPQVNRPITRSFAAQLVKNAQANAAANKVHGPIRFPSLMVLPARVIWNLKHFVPSVSNCGTVCLQQNAAIPPARPAPRLERKAPSKPPPPENVVEISSESDQSKTQSESSASSVRSRKKVINTLTSVLSARSKVRDLSKTSLLW